MKENLIKTHAMARTRVIVRKLASFETLGYTTVTYYYKMGSLTKNEMTELKARAHVCRSHENRIRVNESLLEGLRGNNTSRNGAP